jgi:L-fucose isomerase-like protein
MTLNNVLALDPAVFAEVREKATTAGDVAGAVLVGLIQLASRSSDSSSSKEMEAVADPARYQQIVGAGMSSLVDVVVARLSAER